jgi:ribulose-phosphate 3-epimerase
LNPSTPVSVLDDIAADVDFVLVMSVNPGFGGQSFIPRTLQKIRAVHSLLTRVGSGAFIEVDGGVDAGNIGEVAAAGAGVIVAGHAVFGQPDAAAAVRALRAAANGPDR